MAMLFHFSQDLGTLGEHLNLLMGFKMAESSLSQRRQALPSEVFNELMLRTLKPVGLESKHPEAFYKGFRLVGIDGLTFSLPNNADIQAKVKKGNNQKTESAFGKFNGALLVELIMHNPIAACLGLENESEWALGKKVVSQLPPGCLLLADRLYGCAAFILLALPTFRLMGGEYVLRIKSSIKARRVIQTLSDGSQIIQVEASEPEETSGKLGRVTVREIRATVHRPGQKPEPLRFWTSLMDEKAHPAMTLVELYMRRWEQEL